MAAKKHKKNTVPASSETEKKEILEKEEVSGKEETEEAEEASEEVSEETEAETEPEEAESEEAEAEKSEEDDDAEDASETEEEEDEEDEEEEDDEETDSEPKAKKDRIPVIMIALIYAVIIGVALYFILPSVFAPSFGYTLDEYNARLEQSEISAKLKSSYTTVVPAFKLVDKNSIKEIWSIKEVDAEEQKRLDARFKPFVKTYAATEELENILVEANTRINDGKLTRLCMYCTYDDSHMTMMMVHFGALPGNFFPDMTFNDAVSLIMNSAMEANKEGLYTVKDDIAYRLSADNVGGKLYIKIEVLPAKALKPSQIKTVITGTSEASEATEAAATSAT